jgi:hypothetical protein
MNLFKIETKFSLDVSCKESSPLQPTCSTSLLYVSSGIVSKLESQTSGFSLKNVASFKT